MPVFTDKDARDKALSKMKRAAEGVKP